MLILKVKGVMFASILILTSVACGTKEEEEEDAADTKSGSLTVSCTVDLSDLGQVSCSEQREVSQAVVDAVVATCVSEDDPGLMTGTAGACANKDAAPGVCQVTGDDGSVSYLYQSGTSVTASVAETACTNQSGTFTAK